MVNWTVIAETPRDWLWFEAATRTIRRWFRSDHFRDKGICRVADGNTSLDVRGETAGKTVRFFARSKLSESGLV
jgi:hypothetical protein